MNLKKIIAGVAASVVAVSALAISASAANAGLVFQTNAWTFRNNINQSKAVWWDEFDEANDFDTWNCSDVEITGDGTYTVSFEKNVMEDCKDGPETFWNFLKLQTNISEAEYPDLAITVDKLTVDGREVAAAKDAVLGTDKLAADAYSDIAAITAVDDAYTIGFYNTWNPEQTVIDGTADFGGKVELTFTVTGFGSAEEVTEAGEEAGSGDTTVTDGNKGNSDTGVEGVAVIAGLAVVAAGAVIVAKKRK